ACRDFHSSSSTLVGEKFAGESIELFITEAPDLGNEGGQRAILGLNGALRAGTWFGGLEGLVGSADLFLVILAAEDHAQRGAGLVGRFLLGEPHGLAHEGAPGVAVARRPARAGAGRAADAAGDDLPRQSRGAQLRGGSQAFQQLGRWLIHDRTRKEGGEVKREQRWEVSGCRGPAINHWMKSRFVKSPLRQTFFCRGVIRDNSGPH